MDRETLAGFFADIGVIEGDCVVYDNGYRLRSFTYREIAGMARAFAHRLRENGISKSATVLIWSENRPGWLAALWGCILEGVVLVPIDYRASPHFVSNISKLVKARALLTGEEVTISASMDAPIWRVADIELQSAATLDPRTPISADDKVEIVFTSGATADPKGVVITHRNLLANMVPVEREINRYKKFGRPFFPLRFLNLLPMSHLFGQAMAAYIPPMLAGVVVFLKSLDPSEITRQIHSRRVSVMICVPQMLDVLRGYVLAKFPETAHASSRGRWWIRWWRYRRVHRAFGFKFWAFIVGAAPLPPDLEQFWSRLGFLVIQGYGLTETAPIVTLNHPFHSQRGTVGKPIAGVEVRIASDGEILVRGPNVTTGYFENPAASSQMFDAEGWLHTGDLGEIAPDNSLIVHGRKKDVIILPDGRNIYPEDVERVLENTPGVKEAAVIGPDRVHAVLIIAPGADPNRIVHLANQKLEDHQRIRSVHLWPAESLPRTEGTRKLKRNQIRECLEGKAAAPQPSRTGAVFDLLAKYAPGRAITPDTTLDELGLSSLDRVELMTALGARDETMFSGAHRVADLFQTPPAHEETAERFPTWSRSILVRAVRRVFLPSVVLPLTRYFARIRVHGREHLANLQLPVIFASNHQSHMDTPAIFAALPPRIRYRIAPAMSKEFFQAYFHPAGHTLRQRFIRGLQYTLAVLAFNAFPLPQRESGAGGALRYGGELVSEGCSILIFPEGMRTRRGEILPFQPGVALMAARLGLPIVPVRLRGLDKVLGEGATHATPGRVDITFGPPMRLEPGDWRDLARQVQDAVERL